MGYQIKVDGSLLFSSDADTEDYAVLNPKLTLDVNAAGSLSFVLPPGNVKHGQLQKLKNIITVEQDGERLFRGRVTEIERDIYNQQTVYCEGQKSFLVDSLIAPYNYSGTAHGLFTMLIDNHNEKVDASKRFSVGTIDAVSSSETVTIENDHYTDTNGEIENRLLNAYGGYLRERQEGTVRYLDWVKEYGSESGQAIEFAINMLDLSEKVSTDDVFTVLYPLGAMQINDEGERTAPLTIASVNDGVEYIQDDDAIALFGRIERSYTWSHVENAAELLEKGKEHLKTGAALQTLTIKAVDMHFIDGSIGGIRLGDKVRIVSNPHGIDIKKPCVKMSIDLFAPEESEFTFGEPVRTLLDNVVNTEDDVNGMMGGGGSGGRQSVEDEMRVFMRWAKISADEQNAQILLSAGEINNLAGRTSTAEFAIDGLKADIKLKADLTVVSALSEQVSAAEADINAAEAAIKLKANQTTVDKLTGRVDTAEATLTVQAGEISTKVSRNGVISAINQTAETITIQASKINLSGYVTASQLSATNANISNITSGVTEISVMKATMVNCTSTMLYKGEALSLKTMTVTTPTGTATINYVGH